LAYGLGGISIGLGVAEVAAPGALARLIGVDNSSRTRLAIRLLGVREMLNGVGVFTQYRPAGWLWGRVGGDAIDLSLLGWALANGVVWQPQRAVGAIVAVAGVTGLDAWASALNTRQRASDNDKQGGDVTAPAQHGMDVKATITIKRTPEDLYQVWRNFSNLPRFMKHLEDVQVTGDRRSHWQAKAPANTTIEWDAEITQDQPNALIAWRSLPGAMVATTGEVRFVAAPRDRGTEVRVEMRYEPPAGPLGAVIARLFGENPQHQVSSDLRRFKQIMETGEITQSAASVKGGGKAQPPATPQRETADVR
jgi:uncharacterized membrane protein